MRLYRKLSLPLSFSFFILIGSMQSDPIQSALEKFKEVESYSVTLRSSAKDKQEEIKYFFKRPGFVRMDFINPRKGAILVYNPHTKKVTLRPLGFLKALVLTLNPDNPILRSSKEHTVDNSDIGVLLEDVKKLQLKGRSEFLREERLANRDCMVINVKSEKNITDNEISQYILWLDKDIFLPLKVEAYDKSGILIERVLMDDLTININLSDDFFDL